jgi:hypothetical protein
MKVLKIAILLVLVVASSFGDEKEDKQRIDQARDTYASLSKFGFNGFKAQLLPDWKTITGGAGDQERVSFLNQLQFAIAVNREGTLTLSYRVPYAPEGQNIRPSIDQLHDGMRTLLTGFFQMWAPLALTSPLPKASEQYQLEKLKDGYRCTFDEKGSHVELLLDPNFLLLEMKTQSEAVNGVIRPSFTKTAKGLVVSRIVGEYLQNGVASTVDVAITNAEVGGLSLPTKLDINVLNGQSKFKLPLELTGIELRPVESGQSITKN